MRTIYYVRDLGVTRIPTNYKPNEIKRYGVDLENRPYIKTIETDAIYCASILSVPYIHKDFKLEELRDKIADMWDIEFAKREQS